MAKTSRRAAERRKRPRVSIHRQYTIEEAARAIGRCRATIKRMIKSGLPVIADRRPNLILGEDLASFLRAKRKRQPCALDECYCCKCRQPRKMEPGLVDFVPTTSTGGRLAAMCAECGTVMNKRVALSGLAALKAIMDVSIRASGTAPIR